MPQIEVTSLSSLGIFHPKIQPVVGIRTEPPSMWGIEAGCFHFPMPVFVHPVSTENIHNLYLSPRQRLPGLGKRMDWCTPWSYLNLIFLGIQARGMGVVKYRYLSPLIAPVWLSIPVSVGPWREFVLWEKVNNGSNRLLKQADMQYLSYMLESSKITLAGSYTRSGPWRAPTANVTDPYLPLSYHPLTCSAMKMANISPCID